MGKASAEQEAVRRIGEMEPVLEECNEAIKSLSRALDHMDALRDPMTRLFAYYGSEDWHSDRELDEQGRLPEGLKRGVLSEDLIYDAITDLRDAAFRMLEQATDILKNRI